VAETYHSFAGRKLVGLVVCTGAMVFTAIGTLGLSAAEMLDGTFAQNLTITVVGGIATLYGTFVGGNYGEHVAQGKYGQVKRGDGSTPPPVAPSPEPSLVEEVVDPPTEP
jgi:hypothetical protein